MKIEFLETLVFLMVTSVPAAAGVTATYSLGGIAGSPGAQATVPFTVRASNPIIGFSFSIDFDEEVLEATQIELVYHRPDGEPLDFVRVDFNNDNFHPGNGGVDEGYVAGGILPTYDSSVTLPADVDNEVLALHFLIKKTAPLNSTTALSFVEGATSTHIRNWLTGLDRTVPDSYAVAAQTEGTLVVIGSVIKLVDRLIVRRGDGNNDGRLDISDPVALLTFLFQGGPPPACPGAADFNQDGKLDIADPIAILSTLFLGAPMPGGDEPAEVPCR
jgi:hypothetical protein